MNIYTLELIIKKYLRRKRRNLMWEHKFFELFTTIIPQSFAIVFLFFSLIGIKIEIKTFSMFSIILAVIVYLIRPCVNFGVHSAIMVFLLIIIAVTWRKINIFSSFIYSVATISLAYVSEWVTFLFLQILKFNIRVLSTDTTIRVIIGVIPIVILFAIGLTTYYIKNNIKKNKETVKDVN